MSVPPPPLSPGVGARRKGPKVLPRLPLSVFTPPASGASDTQFPLPPSPSSVHPQTVIDAHVRIQPDGANLAQWRSEIAKVPGNKMGGVVVSLQDVEVGNLAKTIAEVLSGASGVPVIGITVPLPLENDAQQDSQLNVSSSNVPVNFVTTLKKQSPSHAEGIKWALQQGRVVDVDVQCNVADGEAGWEALEDTLAGATAPPEERKGRIVLSSILPPHSQALPIVKLLTDSAYISYQDHIASLSFHPNAYVKFLPPRWNAPTPRTPPPSAEATGEQAGKEAKEWKRRIKMYLGPAVEAFGCRRIMFGSSPSPASDSPSNAADWYELTRECFAELGLEQEDIDAVFANNAKAVYGSN